MFQSSKRSSAFAGFESFNGSTGCYVDVKPSNTRMLFFL
jgi:hypothetical protein